LKTYTFLLKLAMMKCIATVCLVSFLDNPEKRLLSVTTTWNSFNDNLWNFI